MSLGYLRLNQKSLDHPSKYHLLNLNPHSVYGNLLKYSSQLLLSERKIHFLGNNDVVLIEKEPDLLGKVGFAFGSL